MRLKAAIWVKAYLRTCMAAGAQAVVARHGDDDAGAIFLKVTRADRTSQIFAPAPTGFEEAAYDRRWICVSGAAPIDEREADARLEREAKLDSDMWLIEVEERSGRNFLDDWLMKSET